MGPVADDRQQSSRLLESLPARPPTPPRETVRNDLDVLPTQLIAPQLDRLRSLQTPPGISSPTVSSKDSTTRRKRVGFSVEPQYQEPPIYTDPSSKRQQPTPSSLQSNSSSRPVKGILKPTATPNRLGPANGVYLDIDKPGKINIAEMLESTLQQLAGADRDSKIDAYTMLWRGLKASSNLPDRIALQEKLGLFMQFIQRDLTLKSSTGIIDLNLVTSATNLLHTFLRYQGIAASIPNDFGIFLVEHCVRCFEDSNSPKQLVRYLMHALYLQNFAVEVMSLDRIGRLVNALHNLENHVSKKSIIQGRIQVYEKLVKQCPQQMAIHSDWLQDLFTDMMSNVSDIRDAASRLGLNAAFTLNKDKRLVTRAMDLLNLTLDDRKYVELIAERLNCMLQSKDECLAVPRIWSIVILFVANADLWNYLLPWLAIIQATFNHADYAVRKEATHAWSRFTYRLFLDRRLERPKNLTLVRGPFLSQLKYKNLRESVLGSIRNFYYYAFKPEMTPQLLDDTWDQAVEPLITRLIGQARNDEASITQAASILTGLLDCKTRRNWTDGRIADPAPIADEELLAIEAKWVRANSKRIFALVGSLMEKNFVELALPDSPTRRLWVSIVHSVASASVKDVKLHDDTAMFVAAAFNFLSTVWEKGPTSSLDGKPYGSVRFLNSTRDFILVLIEGIGLLPNPFMDKPFARTKDGDYIPLSTRMTKHQTAKRPPLHHLFLLLSRLPPAIPDNEAFCNFFESIFARSFQNKSTKAQAELANELLRLPPPDACCPYGPWVMCANKISASLKLNQDSPPTGSPGSGVNLGSAFREVVKFLERGLRSTPNLPEEPWMLLFDALQSRVRNEAGDAGVAMAVVEPLSIVVKDLVLSDARSLPLDIVDAATELIAASTQPRDKQAVDAARRILWGTPNAGTRGVSFDPFQQLYTLITSLLQMLYANIGSCRSANVLHVLDQVTRFLGRGNPQLLLQTCAAIQDGMVCWLQDENHRVTNTDFPGIADSVRSLWLRLCTSIVDNLSDKLPLDVVEPLLCAAFRSTHRDIVRIAIETWNRIYDNAEHIDYPETLKTVLESLGSSVEIIRPGIDVRDDQSTGLHFSESQEQAPNLPVISPIEVQSASQFYPSSTRRSATPGSGTMDDSHDAQDEGVRAARARSRGRTPRTKPRHEDSQIQFAPVQPSSDILRRESQILTERQMEVRERQRETAAMFPEMRSSPTEKTKKARMTNTQIAAALPEVPRASTPRQDGDFDDCLTSTPTPRRGEPISLPEQDHEMTDPPSSPPEPRSGRLLAELKSQNTKTTNEDEWQFSSSPVSGSPNPANDIVSASQPMNLDEINEDLQLDSQAVVSEKIEVADGAGNDDTSGQDTDVIEDTTFFGHVQETSVPTTALLAVVQQSQPSSNETKSQPSRNQVIPGSTDDSLNAPSRSPRPTSSQRMTMQRSLPATSRPSAPKAVHSQSFNVSASFENGLHNVEIGRLEIPLRSSQASSPGKSEYRIYQEILPESPEQALERQQAQEAISSPPKSIEVAGGRSVKPKRGRPKRVISTSASQNSQQSQDSQDSQALQAEVPAPFNQVRRLSESQELVNVSPGSGFWWRKRKRSVSSVFSSGGSKRARYGDFLAENPADNMEEIPDSQPAAVGNQGPPEETQTADDLYQNDISLALGNTSSPAERAVASQELPSVDEEPAQEPTGDQIPAQADIEEQLEVPVENAKTKPIKEPANIHVDEHVEDHLDASAQVLYPESQAKKDELMMDVDLDDETDDEEAVHSQLAREEEESASRAASPFKASYQPFQPPLEEPAEPILVPGGAPVMAQEQADAVEPELEQSKFDGMMRLFRSGLDMLRSVNVSREQFYQAEDVMFEMRRELLEAEKRCPNRK